MPEPTKVWMVQLDRSSDDIEGTLTLEDQALRFDSPSLGIRSIALTAVERVKRIWGSPVLLVRSMEEGDKFGHGLAYATLMSWFANLYEVSARRMQFAIGFIALSIALEFVQRWTGYRSFEVADMVAGAAGVAAGWIFAPPRVPNYLRGTEKFLLRK